MKKEKVRILHITEMLSAAGIESFIMNIYRRIDREKVQFDFLVLRDQKEFYDEEIKKLGGKKYCVISNKKNTLIRIMDESKKIETFLKKNKYDIVHIHYTTPLRAPYLLALKKAGVKARIYHAHSAYVLGKNKMKLIIYDYMRKKITGWGTHFFACSEAAARWIFEDELIKQDKVQVIYNGIDTEKFKYNLQAREQIRKEYNLKDNYVVIHTGRFTEQKNQKFLVRIFEKLEKEMSNAVLMLLGDGELKGEVEQLVKQKGLNEKVLFLGVRPDVNRFLSAADCYVMPSLYEGLPVAAVEAECSGLPCIFSKNITNEVALTDQCSFLSLDEGVDVWLSEIKNYYNENRLDASMIVRENGYDVQDIADKMQAFYLKQARR